MKIGILLFLAAICSGGIAIPVSAQTSSPTDDNPQTSAVVDSVGTQLDEVVVEGRTQRVIKNGVEYIPGKNMKKTALDAYNLLYNMQIPKIVVSPLDNSVTSPTGQGIAMFIDFRPASKEELDGLRPDDVLRVEVLDHPEDPRFEGNLRVVNFIMKKYEWGGYTKLTAFGSVLRGETVRGSAYSKFVTGNWSIDAFASGVGSWCDKWKQSETSILRNFYYGGEYIDELTRTASTDDSYTRKNNQQASLRFTYNADTKYIRHTIGFSRNATPYQKNNLSVDFTRSFIQSSEALSTDHTQSINVSAAGYYQFMLPQGNSFSLSWNYSHSGNNANSLYELGGQNPILNGNREKAHQPELGFFYSKYFSHNNSLNISAFSINTFYDTDYSGSFEGKEKMVSSETMLWAEYTQSFKFGLSMFARAGATYTLGRLNGENLIHQWNPRLGLQLQYRPNDKNMFGIEGWLYNSYPDPKRANGALVRSNELLWSQGNPDLKSVYGRSCEASYTFIPRNNFSLTAAVNYQIGINAPYYDYISVPDVDGLVRTFGLNNREKQLKGLLTASLRLLNNSLGFYVQGGVKRQVNSGLHPMNKTSLIGMANVNYFIGNFAATLYYAPPTRDIFETNGIYESGEAGYGLNLSYALKSFRFKFEAVNLFNSGRFHRTYYSDLFSMKRWNWVDGRDKGLRLTVTYTLPYGKKVGRNDELQDATKNRSAILEH